MSEAILSTVIQILSLISMWLIFALQINKLYKDRKEVIKDIPKKKYKILLKKYGLFVLFIVMCLFGIISNVYRLIIEIYSNEEITRKTIFSISYDLIFLFIFVFHFILAFMTIPLRSLIDTIINITIEFIKYFLKTDSKIRKLEKNQQRE